MGSGESPPNSEGHRARLRHRLLHGGPEALADYEILEYLLFAARTRGDTKPVAKALLARFGSLAQVLNAEPSLLAQVEGVGEVSAAALKIVALAARRMARSEVQTQPVIGSWQALLDYLAIDMAHLNNERVRVLYLNSQNRLIRDELAAAHGRELPELSMGMSHDFAIAIEEGATLVRIGSSLFGPR